MDGWIKLHRKSMDNPYYFAEKFTRWQAWADLLLLASHKKEIYYNRGVRVDIGEGQIAWGLDKLSQRWKWSRGKVERFLHDLETDRQIVMQKNNVTTLISISNWKEYQANSKANSKANGQQTGKQTGNIQECKECKEVKKHTKEDRVEHPFSESIYFENLELFYKHFNKKTTTADYSKFDWKYYYEEVKGWEGKKAIKKDWISTAHNFARRDEKEGKAVYTTEWKRQTQKI